MDLIGLGVRIGIGRDLFSGWVRLIDNDRDSDGVWGLASGQGEFAGQLSVHYGGGV
jgi:hypothetical protein